MWSTTGSGPGFVDLQVNGYGGVDFAGPELTLSDAQSACHSILASGTAAFLPTLISAPLDVYRRNLPILTQVIADPEFEGRVLGVHLEGPFIANDPRVLGAHRADNVRSGSPALLADLQDWAAGQVRLVTLAAEIDGSVALAQTARKLGMCVSIGHSYPSRHQLQRMVDAGATALTHFGNGIPLSIPRHDNPTLVGLCVEGLKAMMIVDGHHVSEVFAHVARRVFGASNLILVSDAAPLQGLPPGPYRVFDQDVVLEPSGRIYNAAEQHLCGSAQNLLDCVNVALSWNLLSVEEAIASAFHLPLAVLDLTPGIWSTEQRIVLDENTRRFHGA